MMSRFKDFKSLNLDDDYNVANQHSEHNPISKQSINFDGGGGGTEGKGGEEEE